MKYIMMALVLMLVAACEKPPASVMSTDNREFPVATLFTHEGCTLYRFKDHGNPHYYSKCEGGSSSVMSRVGAKHKRPEEVSTYYE